MTDPAVLAVFQVFAVLFGLVIGSFLNVCIVRMPEDRSVVTPRSQCPRCGTTLGAADLVPVASWLWLRGRCRTCHTPIAPFYPLIELLGGLLAWLLFRRLIGDPADLDLAHGVAFAVWYAFLGLLVVAAYVDVRHWIIPDQVSIYAVPAGVLGALALQAVQWEGFPDVDLRASIIGAMLGGSALATASILARWVLGREALGWGDVKLIAMIGAFVGPLPVIFLVLMPASLIGALAGFAHLAWTRRRAYLPFGPSIALAAVLYVFWGDVIARFAFPGLALWMGLL